MVFVIGNVLLNFFADSIEGRVGKHTRQEAVKTCTAYPLKNFSSAETLSGSQPQVSPNVSVKFRRLPF